MPRRKKVDFRNMCRKEFPEYFEILLPMARKGSKEMLGGEPCSLMILAKEDMGTALRLLELADGFLDLATDLLQACMLTPVSWEEMARAIDTIEASRFAGEFRSRMMPFSFTYVACNQDVMPGLDRLLDRYRRMDGDLPFNVAIRWPQLAGSSPSLLCEFAERHPEAMGYRPLHELAHGYHEATLMAVFGDQWRRWVRLRYFGESDPDDLHSVYMAAQFLFKEWTERNRPRSSFKRLGNFILSNLDFGFGNLSFCAQHWDRVSPMIGMPDFRGRFQELLGDIWQDEFGWELSGDEDIDEMRMALSAAKVKQADFDRVIGFLDGIGRAPLPEWAQIEPFSIGRYRARFLPRDDYRAPFIGVYSGNCQRIYGLAASCALHGTVSPLGATFVVEEPDRPTGILASSWAWEDGNGTVVFDSVEGPAVRGTNDARVKRVIDAYRMASGRIFDEGRARSVLMGTLGYGLREEHVGDMTRWRHGSPTEPPDYADVTESLRELYGDSEVSKYPPDSRRRKVVLAGCKHPKRVSEQ